MCGIIGYSGSNTNAVELLLEGLEKVEYRGYDSAGIAFVTDSGIQIEKKEGKLENLKNHMKNFEIPSCTGIGHTRWATHGVPTDRNAHPHYSENKDVALIHNGIIENAPQLKFELQSEGYHFASSTDTEVAAKLLGKIQDQIISEEGKPDLFKAMRRTARMVTGTFTLLAVDVRQPDIVVGARHDSPLVVGIGDGENFLGSDVAAFVAYTKRALELGQDEAVMISADAVTVTDFDGNPAQPREYTVDWDISASEKGGWDSFMDKEIHEQPAAVADTLRGRVDERGELQLDEMRIDPAVLRSVDKIIVIACGTAAYAGHVAKYAIEHWCRIPVEVELAHEFRYRDPVVSEKTLTVAISQSGETMDTIQAVRHAREQGSKVLAIVNTYGSTIAREADAVLYTHAGPEVAVASTKAFLAQITACYLLGLYLAQLRGNKWPDEVAEYLDNLAAMPDRIQHVLDHEEARVRELGTELADKSSFLFLGRHVGFPVALEGALKLKELAYVHAEGFAAGELKHGPIALIEEGLPVFVIVPTPRRPVLHDKVISNIQEIRARGARTIVIAEEGDTDVEPFADHIIRVPATPTILWPLLTVVPLQIFAAALAGAKGLDIDQPRNLAKSVTVE